jgi:hypothetical protein
VLPARAFLGLGGASFLLTSSVPLPGLPLPGGTENSPTYTEGPRTPRGGHRSCGNDIAGLRRIVICESCKKLRYENDLNTKTRAAGHGTRPGPRAQGRRNSQLWARPARRPARGTRGETATGQSAVCRVSRVAYIIINHLEGHLVRTTSTRGK